METKKFSVQDGTLVIFENLHIAGGGFDLKENGKTVASTNDFMIWDDIYKLPPSLIRKPKSAEELAEEYYPKETFNQLLREGFLAGRQSVGGEFHLTRDELEKVIKDAQSMNKSQLDIISSLTPPIYPHTITVEHDGEKYYWETLKAIY